LTPGGRLSGITREMGLQYDNPNVPGNDSLRTQRMTADEAASVIALWQQERVEQTGLTDRPAVPDVAEGLDIPVEEVQRLLAEIRRQRAELRGEPAHRQRRTEPCSRWVETKPGVWEDVNQQEPPSLVPSGAKVAVVILCLIWSTVISVIACLGWILGSVARN